MNEKLKTILLSGLSLIVAILLVIVCATPINVPQRQVYAENRIQNEMVLDSSTESQISSYTTSNIVLPNTDVWYSSEAFNGVSGYYTSRVTMIKLYFYQDQGYTYMRILSLGTIVDSITPSVSRYNYWYSATQVNINGSAVNYFYFNNQYWTDYRLNDNVFVNRNTSDVSGSVYGLFRISIGSANEEMYLNNILFDTSGSVDIDFFSATLGSDPDDYYGQPCEYITYSASAYTFKMVFVAFDNNALMLDTRTYVTNIESTDDYELGYLRGKQDGSVEAIRDNRQSWYDDGYTAGERAGDSAGYNRGLNDANQYTFLNLFGALFDAPVQAFTGLLDFDVFGIDAKSLVLSLFTLCIVLVIIRLATKGGGN